MQRDKTSWQEDVRLSFLSSVNAAGWEGAQTASKHPQPKGNWKQYPRESTEAWDVQNKLYQSQKKKKGTKLR